MDYVASLSPEQQEATFPEGTMNRNIKDVLAHLYHWHLMVLDWYKVGMAGQTPHIPAQGYNWRQLPALNKKIWEQYRHTPLQEAITHFESTHEQIMALVAQHSNEELFERARYAWTGNNALGAYLVSCTSSHYDWAIKLIKKAQKKLAAA